MADEKYSSLARLRHELLELLSDDEVAVPAENGEPIAGVHLSKPAQLLLLNFEVCRGSIDRQRIFLVYRYFFI